MNREKEWKRKRSICWHSPEDTAAQEPAPQEPALQEQLDYEIPRKYIHAEIHLTSQIGNPCCTLSSLQDCESSEWVARGLPKKVISQNKLHSCNAPSLNQQADPSMALQDNTVSQQLLAPFWRKRGKADDEKHFECEQSNNIVSQQEFHCHSHFDSSSDMRIFHHFQAANSNVCES